MVSFSYKDSSQTLKILEKTSKVNFNVKEYLQLTKQELFSSYHSGILLAETEFCEKSKKRNSDLEKVKIQLQNWREEFEVRNKRKPNRKDMLNDPVANSLFLTFSKLNK